MIETVVDLKNKEEMDENLANNSDDEDILVENVKVTDCCCCQSLSN